MIGKLFDYLFDKWVPIIFLSLSFWDLRVDISLLLDHFTFTSLVFAIKHHILAVTVLACLPSIWKRYGRSNRIFGGS